MGGAVSSVRAEAGVEWREAERSPFLLVPMPSPMLVLVLLLVLLLLLPVFLLVPFLDAAITAVGSFSTGLAPVSAS